MNRIDFQTDPSRYRHWRLEFDGPVASLIMDVDANAGLFDGCELKLNSYDLGVDIELYDAVQRLRFEHPEVGAIVLRSGKPGVFCAGANIRMLGRASHGHKVNFCKFTNETRLAIEDASANSGQTYIAAVSGSAAGGGYELALACDHIMLVDDHRSTVALPEAPMLAVLPGTGGLTRLTDKRRVRRDLADVFCLAQEGVRGRRAVEWRLVDDVVAPSAWDDAVMRRARDFAAKPRSSDVPGIALTPLKREFAADRITYPHLSVALDRTARVADLTVQGPRTPAPDNVSDAESQGAAFWPLAMARALDDAILHLRLNEPELGLWVLRTEGDPNALLAYDAFVEDHQDHWLMREIRHYLKRTLKRLDVTARSLIALIEPGSCFSGTLAELAFAADRSVMLAGARDGDNTGPAALTLNSSNFGAYPMGNGLTRLATRFLGEPAWLEVAMARIGEPLDSAAAEAIGLITAAYDSVDWDDEVRILLEERASFSPDALSGLEANLRFAGPETMETRIFGRLSVWQNWIFQRANAVGEHGALPRYGTGVQPEYDWKRV